MPTLMNAVRRLVALNVAKASRPLDSALERERCEASFALRALCGGSAALVHRAEAVVYWRVQYELLRLSNGVVAAGGEPANDAAHLDAAADAA
jgi:hypothetical protein